MKLDDNKEQSVTNHNYYACVYNNYPSRHASLWNMFIKSLCLIIRQTEQKTEELKQKDCVYLHLHSTAVKPQSQGIHYTLIIHCKSSVLI